jgi:beta-phosphoglucomutase-like phosphatase (HAD superfamily)
MQAIECLMLEPVGCLAEFPSAPFHEIAVRGFGRRGKASPSGSRSYWHLLNLIEPAETPLVAEELEAEAVAASSIYEDVVPVLAELRSMDIRLVVATSLSRAAAMSFVERFSLGEFLTGIWARDDSGGVKSAPLRAALAGA